MKSAHDRKRVEASPTARKLKTLHEAFARGNPTGEGPSKIRTYGDIAKDVPPELPQPKVAPLSFVEKQAKAAQTAVEYGLKRAVDKRQTSNSGVSKMSPTSVTLQPGVQSPMSSQRPAGKV